MKKTLFIIGVVTVMTSCTPQSISGQIGRVFVSTMQFDEARYTEIGAQVFLDNGAQSKAPMLTGNNTACDRIADRENSGSYYKGIVVYSDRGTAIVIDENTWLKISKGQYRSRIVSGGYYEMNLILPSGYNPDAQNPFKFACPVAYSSIEPNGVLGGEAFYYTANLR